MPGCLYDLTTDVSVGSLAGRQGVVAGSARWLPPGLLDGAAPLCPGRGTGGVFRRGRPPPQRPGSAAGCCGTPPRPGAENAPGERTAVFRADPAPLSVEDELDLFEGNRFLGEFSVFERSAGSARRRGAGSPRAATRSRPHSWSTASAAGSW